MANKRKCSSKINVVNTSLVNGNRLSLSVIIRLNIPDMTDIWLMREAVIKKVSSYCSELYYSGSHLDCSCLNDSLIISCPLCRTDYFDKTEDMLRDSLNHIARAVALARRSLLQYAKLSNTELRRKLLVETNDYRINSWIDEDGLYAEYSYRNNQLIRAIVDSASNLRIFNKYDLPDEEHINVSGKKLESYVNSVLCQNNLRILVTGYTSELNVNIVRRLLQQNRTLHDLPIGGLVARAKYRIEENSVYGIYLETDNDTEYESKDVLVRLVVAKYDRYDGIKTALMTLLANNFIDEVTGHNGRARIWRTNDNICLLTVAVEEEFFTPVSLSLVEDMLRLISQCRRSQFQHLIN